jgi:signal transduction histidine kinase/ligand-binding sensor domain-containing protein
MTTGLDSLGFREQDDFVHHPFPTRQRRAGLLCGCLLLLALAAWGAGTVPNYFVRVWQVEDGLPQNQVTAVVQTRDGYLWAGTYSGLARFDGVRFTVFDDKNTSEMHSSRVTSLFESGDGTLWIGHENGEVTTCKDGKFRPVEIRAVWASRKIYGITADDAGDVWLLDDVGLLARVRDGLVLSPQSGPAVRLLGLARSTNGTVWVARDGGLSVLDHGQLRAVQFDEPFTNTYVQGICPCRDGGLWVGSNGRIRKWKNDQWVQDLGAAPWETTPLTGLFETRNGTLVATTVNAGLFLLFPGTGAPPLHYDHFNGVETERILSLMEDREGNLWVGTGGNGLIEMRQSIIQTVEPPDHWHGRALLSVFPGRDGELWIGTEGAGLYRQQNGDWINFGYTNFSGSSYVWSLAKDVPGQLWVGTWGAGLFLQRGEHFEGAPGMEGAMMPMPALLAARSGGLWIGSAVGLGRYQDGKTNWFTEANGKPLREVRTIAEAADGAVWFGMVGYGLACLENDRIRQFQREDGLPSNDINCLHFDEDGALWIGTSGGGLCRLKAGHFSLIDRAQGLPNSVIGNIEDDGHGFFWMSSHGGIIRASKAELNNCADGKIRAVRCVAYGINDGMPTIECSTGLQPAGCKTPDGRLWFPTSKGLVVINPEEVKINDRPPPMALEELLVDGELVTNTVSPLQIPAGRNRFEFHYTALSLVVPEKVSFKYRIEGLEKEWVDAGTKRVADYNFLPPGNYTFQVIACNNDGIWNETGVTLPFTLLPYFWQTLWFRALASLTIMAVAGGAVWIDARRRLHRRLEKLERQQAIERERARIAKDIHDDLGASLTRIIMLSQPERGEMQAAEQGSANLERIHGTARELTRSMDEIVWAVNPRHDTLDSLASYLSRFAYDFLSAANVRCRLDVPLQFPAWPLTAEVRHNLFLAFKETLHNVVSHAAAAEVRVALQLAGEKIVLTVTDDGCGFNVAEPNSRPLQKPGQSSQGDGLANIKRRLAEIGGECEIQSAPGQGTTVKFIVPVKA